MKWILLSTFLLCCGAQMSAQKISFGVGTLFQPANMYEEQKITQINDVNRVLSPAEDSVYVLYLLETRITRDHAFKASLGWQVDANVDFDLFGPFAGGVGLGLRGRTWKHEEGIKFFEFYANALDTLDTYNPPPNPASVVCDVVLPIENFAEASDESILRNIDLIIPVSLTARLGEKMDMGANFVFSTPLISSIEHQFHGTDNRMEGDELICQQVIKTETLKSPDFLRQTRLSSELFLTYWINKIGIQAIVQTSSQPLFDPIEENPGAADREIFTDGFKPRYMGLKVKYRLGLGE